MNEGNAGGRPPVGCVLFDLDGTFADTAPDLAYALNLLLEAHDQPPADFRRVREAASHGGRALIQVGFGLSPEDNAFEPLRQELLALYRGNIQRHTRLFPGMAELIERLEEQGLRWGLVTNKPGWLTEPLIAGLGLNGRAACVVSGDTTAHAKPHPGPILHACKLAASDPRACLYVGDAERDIRAGRSAGTATLVALFGYIGAQDRPREWGADGCIEHPLQVLDWLGVDA
jgi:phosphoglycolate phosphatase